MEWQIIWMSRLIGASCTVKASLLLYKQETDRKPLTAFYWKPCELKAVYSLCCFFSVDVHLCLFSSYSLVWSCCKITQLTDDC